MRIKSLTTYRFKGKRRRIRLFGAWIGLNQRCQGLRKAGNGSRAWKGLEIGFKSWPEFREWALKNGYSRKNNSLDRYPDHNRGYFPDNCRWVTVSKNTSFQNSIRWAEYRENRGQDDEHTR